MKGFACHPSSQTAKRRHQRLIRDQLVAQADLSPFVRANPRTLPLFEIVPWNEHLLLTTGPVSLKGPRLINAISDGVKHAGQEQSLSLAGAQVCCGKRPRILNAHCGLSDVSRWQAALRSLKSPHTIHSHDPPKSRHGHGRCAKISRRVRSPLHIWPSYSRAGTRP